MINKQKNYIKGVDNNLKEELIALVGRFIYKLSLVIPPTQFDITAIDKALNPTMDFTIGEVGELAHQFLYRLSERTIVTVHSVHQEGVNEKCSLNSNLHR